MNLQTIALTAIVCAGCASGNVAKNAKIAGFRPGKAPLNVIKQRYGDSARQEALSEVIQSSLYDAPLISTRIRQDAFNAQSACIQRLFKACTHQHMITKKLLPKEPECLVENL